MIKFTKRLKDIREDRDLKQSDVATVLKTTQSTYSKYERGERRLDVEQLAELCKFYNVTADYFLGLTDKQRPIK